MSICRQKSCGFSARVQSITCLLEIQGRFLFLSMRKIKKWKQHRLNSKLPFTCRVKKNLKTLWMEFTFMDGVQLPQGYSHFEEVVSLVFTTLSYQKLLVLIFSTSERWTAESTLEPPSCFEHGTPGLKSSPLTTKLLLLILAISKVFTFLSLLCLCANRKYPSSF